MVLTLDSMYFWHCNPAPWIPRAFHSCTCCIGGVQFSFFTFMHVFSYNQFMAEETKRKWTWSKIYSKELELWAAVPPYIFCEC